MNDFVEYSKRYLLKMKKEDVKQILDWMIELRATEKKWCIDELPDNFSVIHCNCSDGDILNDNTSDAYYLPDYPHTIFVDPYFKEKLWVNIAHELIHDLQQIIYVYMDGTHTNYRQRWEENMAFQLENKVSIHIKKNKVSYRLKNKKHFEIEEYLLNTCRFNDI